MSEATTQPPAPEAQEVPKPQLMNTLRRRPPAAPPAAAHEDAAPAEERQKPNSGGVVAQEPAPATSSTRPAPSAPPSATQVDTPSARPAHAQRQAQGRRVLPNGKTQVTVTVVEETIRQVDALKSYLGMDAAEVVLRSLSESPDRLREALAYERDKRVPEGAPQPTASPFAAQAPRRTSARGERAARYQLGFYITPANLEILDQIAEQVGASARPELLIASIGGLYRACKLS